MHVFCALNLPIQVKDYLYLGKYFFIKSKQIDLNGIPIYLFDYRFPSDPYRRQEWLRR